MGIILITLAILCVMYGLTFISYISENNVVDELISNN